MIEKRLGNLFCNDLEYAVFYELLDVKYGCTLDQFEDTHYKEKLLVEKVGVQTQTSSKDPTNLDIRRTVVGPNLYFKADGTE